MRASKLKKTATILTVLVVILACNDNKNKPSEKVEQAPAQPTKVLVNRSLPTVNIKENDTLTSPAIIKVNSQGLWFATEGSLGYVQLLDEQGIEIATGFLSTNENWMTDSPVNFTTKLTFDATKSKTGTLVIHNDPGSGDGDEAGEEISFTIPVTF